MDVTGEQIHNAVQAKDHAALVIHAGMKQIQWFKIIYVMCNNT